MLDKLMRVFRPAAPEPGWIEGADLRRRLARGETPLIIDVRGPDEFDGPFGHIDGAQNVPLPGFAQHVAALAQEARPIVLVCLTDKRSATAAMQLAEAGIRDVTVLRGGMRDWRASEKS